MFSQLKTNWSKIRV